MSLLLRTMLTLLLLVAAVQVPAQEVVISCDSGLRWAYITEAGLVSRSVVLEGKTRTKQVLSTASLPPTPEAAKLSTGSRGKVETATCGPFTFVLSSISISSADVASVVSVWEGKERVLGPLALGWCELDRSGWGECPSQSVTSVTLRWGEAAKFSPFSLEHSFQEFRERPNKALKGTPRKRAAP